MHKLSPAWPRTLPANLIKRRNPLGFSRLLEQFHARLFGGAICLMEIAFLTSGHKIHIIGLAAVRFRNNVISCQVFSIKFLSTIGASEIKRLKETLARILYLIKWESIILRKGNNLWNSDGPTDGMNLPVRLPRWCSRKLQPLVEMIGNKIMNRTRLILIDKVHATLYIANVNGNPHAIQDQNIMASFKHTMMVTKRGGAVNILFNTVEVFKEFGVFNKTGEDAHDLSL